MNKQLTALFLFAFSATAFAQTQVPNQFQSGTPARAAEVNANFDALEAAIDANATAITQIPAGPEGPQGLQGPQGVQGPEGPPGADLSNEVSIIQGEQVVQNDRIGDVEADVARNASDILNNSNSIADLNASNGVQVFAQGVSIGKLVQFNREQWPVASQMLLVSDRGYLFSVFTSADPSNVPGSATLWFSDPNCLGTAMAAMEPTAASLGMVFRGRGPDATTPAYYVPRGSDLPRTMGFQSWYRNVGECVNQASTRISLVVVLQNDPAVTGVSDLDPVQPLTIGVP